MVGKGRVSLVMCAKNEAKTIGDILKRCKPFCDELIVVDGHSEDKTSEIAKRAGARVVLDNKKGKGEAIRVGIESSKGDVIVFIDADGSHVPEDIPQLIEPIIKGEADLVIASRMTGGSEELHGDTEKFVRLIGSALITLVINHKWGRGITDSQNGFRAIARDAANELNLKENSFTIETEMLIKCLKKGYRVMEVPSLEKKRLHGESGIKLHKMWYKYVWTVLKNIF